MIVDLANVLVSLVIILSCLMILDLMIDVLTGYSVVSMVKAKAQQFHGWRKSKKE